MSRDDAFSREDVMEAYLEGLLIDSEVASDSSSVVSKLLENSEPFDRESVAIDSESADAKETEQVSSASLKPQLQEPLETDTHLLQDKLSDQFQALFFEVAGLTLAVPLITLGGIYQIDKIGPLIGKPKWFKGVMLHRDEKINVVDTAMWVMPEKYDQNLQNKLNYQYLIMLGDSPWGLASESLVNNVSLSKADIQWRQGASKRPWLAGMVKEKMCALIDVEELISMLNNGLGSNDQMP